MEKQELLKLLANHIVDEPWQAQLNGYKELAKTNSEDVLGETYYFILNNLHEALVAKNYKDVFVLTLALDAYCKLVLDAHKPADTSIQG